MWICARKQDLRWMLAISVPIRSIYKFQYISYTIHLFHCRCWMPARCQGCASLIWRCSIAFVQPTSWGSHHPHLRGSKHSPALQVVTVCQVPDMIVRVEWKYLWYAGLNPGSGDSWPKKSYQAQRESVRSKPTNQPTYQPTNQEGWQAVSQPTNQEVN